MPVDHKQAQRRAASVEVPAHSWAADLGPGLASVGGDNDPSGIVTYSVAGAQLGYDMLWALVLTYPSIVALQLMSARIAMATGKGLTANMRDHYVRPLFYLAVARFVLANAFNIAADIVAMGAAAQLLWHGSAVLAVLFTALGGVLSLALQWFVPYGAYARIVKWLAAVLFAYVGVTLVMHVPWNTIVVRSLIPRITWSENYFTVLLAVLGTTVSPYLLYSQAEQQVEELRPQPEKRAADTDFRENARKGREGRASRAGRAGRVGRFSNIRTDTLLRVAMSNAVGLFIIAAAAATLHKLDNPQDAARVLAPLVGGLAPQMLALALFGTALLALPPLAGSAAHAAASAFDWQRGEHRDRRIAVTMTVLMVAGGLAGISLSVMHMNPIRILYWSAVLNGMTAAPVMALLVLLGTKRSAVGDLSTHWILRALSWMAIVCMGAAVAARYACKWFS